MLANIGPTMSTTEATAQPPSPDTIDDSKVVARVREILDDHDAQLLEALAELIATTLLREFGMPRLRLSLAKLNLMPGVKKLGITIERRGA